MVKFTPEMKTAVEKTPVFIFATADKNGMPNGVPIGFVKIASDDEIMLVDNFMNKTRRNLDENPQAAVSFWNPEARGGFQMKGRARVETSGRYFEEADRWVKESKVPFPIQAKAAIVIKVEEIYNIGANRDSATNLT